MPRCPALFLVVILIVISTSGSFVGGLKLTEILAALKDIKMCFCFLNSCLKSYLRFSLCFLSGVLQSFTLIQRDLQALV